MAPHSSTLAWQIPWREEPGGLAVHGVAKSRTGTEQLYFHFSLSCIGEGNGNPLQCSCLENPRDGRVWWAAIYGVAQSRTRLNRLSSSNNSSRVLKIATLYKYIQLITDDFQRQCVSSVKRFKMDSENKRDRETALNSNALVWVKGRVL